MPTSASDRSERSRKENPTWGWSQTRQTERPRLPASTTAMPAQILDAVCVRSSTAFPQGSMVGSDPAGAARVKTRTPPRHH